MKDINKNTILEVLTEKFICCFKSFVLEVFASSKGMNCFLARVLDIHPKFFEKLRLSKYQEKRFL